MRMVCELTSSCLCAQVGARAECRVPPSTLHLKTQTPVGAGGRAPARRARQSRALSAPLDPVPKPSTHTPVCAGGRARRGGRVRACPPGPYTNPNPGARVRRWARLARRARPSRASSAQPAGSRWLRRRCSPRPHCAAAGPPRPATQSRPLWPSAGSPGMQGPERVRSPDHEALIWVALGGLHFVCRRREQGWTWQAAEKHKARGRCMTHDSIADLLIALAEWS